MFVIKNRQKLHRTDQNGSLKQMLSPGNDSLCSSMMICSFHPEQLVIFIINRHAPCTELFSQLEIVATFYNLAERPSLSRK